MSDLSTALTAAASAAYALEEAIGRSEAFFDAWPDEYTFRALDADVSHTFDAVKCTFASSNHADRWVASCKSCGWSVRYGDLPRDPCLMYVVPPLCPVCRERGEVSGVNTHGPKQRDSGPLITDGGRDSDDDPKGEEGEDDTDHGFIRPLAEADDADAEGSGMYDSLLETASSQADADGRTWGEIAKQHRIERIQHLRAVCREWAADRYDTADAGDAIAEKIIRQWTTYSVTDWERAVAEGEP